MQIQTGGHNQQRASQHSQGRNAVPTHRVTESESCGSVGNSKSHLGPDDEPIPSETNANDKWEPENSRGPRGYGHSQAYGGALGYQDETLRTPENGQQPYDRVDSTKPPKIKS